MSRDAGKISCAQNSRSVSRTSCLELACFDVDSGLAAIAQGTIQRVELCANRSLGGTTPSKSDYVKLRSTIDSTCSIPRVSVMTMIRPRGGDFHYSTDELEMMQRDLLAFREVQAGDINCDDGFVFGILNEKGRIDEQSCRMLLRAAAKQPCTFHRAFDAIPQEEMEAQLEILIALGFKSVLTSGGQKDALAGKAMLSKLVAMAGTRIQIVVGGGVRSSNLLALQDTGAMWYHSSAAVGDGNASDPEELQAMKNIMDHCSPSASTRYETQ